VTAAIFGLLGVVVGGVLNGAVAYVLDQRREAKVFKLVTRELFEDLTYVGGTIDRTLKDGDWIRWANSLNFGRLELAWRQRRPLVAAHLDWQHYFTLAQAIRSFEMFRDESPRTKERAEAALTDEDREKLTHLYKEIFNGMRCLSKAAEVSTIASMPPAPDPVPD